MSQSGLEAVYVAKSRVLARLKARIRAIDGEAHEM
jgi:hypothetical protein